MRAWIGEKEVSLENERLQASLESGTHVITLVIDRNAFPKPTIEAELIDLPDSTAAAQLVSGS